MYRQVPIEEELYRWPMSSLPCLTCSRRSVPGRESNLVRESVRIVLQELIDTEASAVIGADRYERTPERTTERNGVGYAS